MTGHENGPGERREKWAKIDKIVDWGILITILFFVLVLLLALMVNWTSGPNRLVLP